MSDHVQSPEAAEAPSAAAAELAGSLRSEIVDRAKSKQQIVVLTTGLVGIVASLAGEGDIHPLTNAALAVVFLVLALVVLRHDQEITVIAAYLLDPTVFGDHALVQKGWEKYKYTAMQIGNWRRHPLVAVPGVATYGVPLGAGVVFWFAAVPWPSNLREFGVAAGALLLLVVFSIYFGVEVKGMIAAYRRVGRGCSSAQAAQARLNDSAS